jgi:PAS domain S-box-containing protein
LAGNRLSRSLAGYASSLDSKISRLICQTGASQRLWLAIGIAIFGAGTEWETFHLTGHFISAPVIASVIVIGLITGPILSVTIGAALALFTDYFFIPPIGEILNSVESIEHLVIVLGITLFINALAFTIRRAFIHLETSRALARRTADDLLASERRLKYAIQQRAKSEALLRTITDELPAMVTYIDKEERFLFANKLYEAWIGSERSDILYKTVRDLLTDDNYHLVHPQMLKALRGEKVCYDLEWLNADGETRLFQIYYTPDLNNDSSVRGYVMHGQDVTALRNAVALRDEFIAIASHELKTPLSSLNLSLQLLRRGLSSDAPISADEVVHLVDSSLRQVTSLTTLINDLLDVTRIQSGKLSLNLQNIDLNKAVRHTVEQLSEPLKVAGCHVELDLHDEIVGKWDPSRIEQVLTNLVSNIIKYADNRPAKISTCRQDGSALLVVQDSGTGIRKEDQSRVFERYQRAAPSKSAAGGLGLGLYVVKQIIDQHRGSIHLESDLGKGTKFSIQLPL